MVRNSWSGLAVGWWTLEPGQAEAGVSVQGCAGEAERVSEVFAGQASVE